MNYELSNTIFITLIAALVLLSIYFVFKKELESDEEKVQEDIYSITFLKETIRDLFNGITNQNIAGLYLNKAETKKRERQKVRLKNALRSCAQGNLGDKEFVKDYIKDLIQNNLKISETTIDQVIPFGNTRQLTPQDKFEILLQQYKKRYQYDALEKLFIHANFDKDIRNTFGIYYEVNKDDIENAYQELFKPLTYVDKLEVLTQRIYQETYGFSIMDEIRDMKIDGCSGGVSGISSGQYNYMEEIMESADIVNNHTYDSFWIFVHGKSIHLSFLTFGTMKELVRVCKNLYLYDNIGHLTSSNGYKLNYLQDGSRVVVVRPKLTSSWAFFVRKFDSSKKMPIETLVCDSGNEIVIELVKWLVKGSLNIILSGDQNSGKTTFLKAMVQFIDQRYPIRTTEQEFELWLNNTYPNLNIGSFRGSEEVNLVEAINLQKKTDAAIMILGEVASFELANSYIALTQAGTKSTMCTCHCISTRDLVEYFRNAVLSCGTFTNEAVAEEQVAASVNIDIHWVKSGDGHRHISHITEIIPISKEEGWPKDYEGCVIEALKRMAGRKTYSTRDIIIYESGKYICKNSLSKRSIDKICRNLNSEDREAFINFNNIIGRSSNG
ncbi:MAG: Flp pilus assembly complex ATPase component TadA [Clostridiales bacterium]|nr:Flp pilus assembly complex ATPase component TadA [Clostridiales bacterium]